MPIFTNILSKVEQRMNFVHYQTCYTCSSDGTSHGTIYMDQQSPIAVLPHAEKLKSAMIKKHSQMSINSELTSM